MCHINFEVSVCTFCRREQWGRSWRHKCSRAPGCNACHRRRKDVFIGPDRCYACCRGQAAAASEDREAAVAIFLSKVLPCLVKEVVWM